MLFRPLFNEFEIIERSGIDCMVMIVFNVAQFIFLKGIMHSVSIHDISNRNKFFQIMIKEILFILKALIVFKGKF